MTKIDLTKLKADRAAGTPGDWRHDGFNGVQAYGSVDTCDGGVFGRIATAQRTERRDGKGRVLSVEGSAEANARLIAAVPAMADALIDMEAVLRDMIAMSENDGWDDALDGRRVILSEARAVLAKHIKEEDGE